jgi:hypothetical protein
MTSGVNLNNLHPSGGEFLGKGGKLGIISEISLNPTGVEEG